ncbi:MAG: VanZ family protein [Mesorhizobium sp.]
MSGLHAYVIAVLLRPDMDCGAQARYSQQMIRRFARVLAWLLLAAILFVTISPIRMRPETGEPADVERLIAFAVVGFAFILGYPRHWILVTCLVAGSAFAFEAAQLLSPSRHAHLHDAAIKAIGGVGGILAGAVVNFFRPSLFQAPGED